MTLRELVDSYKEARNNQQVSYNKKNPYGGEEGKKWYIKWLDEQDKLWKELGKTREELFNG